MRAENNSVIVSMLVLMLGVFDECYLFVDYAGNGFGICIGGHFLLINIRKSASSRCAVSGSYCFLIE